MTKNHTNRAYENDLRFLRDRILLIAGRVEKMVANSIRALSKDDPMLARETIAYDKSIDRDEMVIDRLCIELLARWQPLGEDLRFIVSVIKMVTYFERMGDLAVKICHRVIKLKQGEKPYCIDGLEVMARDVQVMIKETVQAFLLRDIRKAALIIKQDENINDMYHQITKQYIKEMTDLGQDIESYFHLMSIAKWLERLGDHCTNLAELIIFMVKGEDIRHQPKVIEKMPAEVL